MPITLIDILINAPFRQTEKGVKASQLDEDDVLAAIRTSFIETSKEMTHDNIKRSGTTAIISLILGKRGNF